MSALSQDSYLNSGYPLFYINTEGTTPDPGPEPPPPPPPVPDPPPIPEPPTNTPGNFGIGGSLILGAFNQNIEAGGLGQLQVVSLTDSSNNLWNEIIGTQTHAGAVARGADTSLWLAGTRDGVGGIEVASGITTTANTYSTQVNVYADMLVAGTIRCSAILPSNPASVVNFTSPTYTTSPGGSSVIAGYYNPVGGFTINVSSLAASRTITIRVVSGTVYNNNPSRVTVYPVWCDLQTNPGAGAAFSPAVFTPCSIHNNLASNGIVFNNGNYALQRVDQNSGAGNMDGSLFMNPVITQYPATGSITLWAYCNATAQPIWFSNVVVQITGN